MGTRTNIHFMEGDRMVANVYRHFDGYPDGVLPDLETFFKEVKDNVTDTKFGDAEYLAAKYVVWQAKQNASTYDIKKGKRTPNDSYLDFLSLGVCIEDHGDIEFIYEINSDTGMRDDSGYPAVRWRSTYGNEKRQWQQGVPLEVEED